MLIDTHCHLDFPEFDADREEVIRRAKDSGVEYIINVGSSLENSRAAVKLSKEYPAVFASVGIHPHDAKDFSEDNLLEIKELSKNPKVIAIGEVGLDFYRNLSEESVQEEVFRKFIGLAKERNLPLIFHCREAKADFLRILKEESFPQMRGVMHCFSGDKDFLRECLDLGLYVSFTCNVTYKKADNLCQVLKLVPQDKLMLETDAPYLSPEGFRGKRNEPYQVKLLAETIAKIRSVTFGEIAEATTVNAKKLFGLDI
ncbi:MAG: TatD family hydrolase [Candidatus Omnitrophota bacterium]|nr:TatD family hydrolase [Candidatus Omnitrophota bacterium]